MSSPAPFYRYSNVTTPGTAGGQERSSPPSSGAIDLAETLVEFSSPAKLREPLVRRTSASENQDESPRPLGKSASLGDLQGVDLLRGFEKISSTWGEGGSPIKEVHVEESTGRRGEENARSQSFARNGITNDKTFEGVNGVVLECSVRQSLSSSSAEALDSQMTEVKMEA